MNNKSKKRNQGIFEVFASKVTKATGSTGAFLLAFFTVIAWAVTGPIFQYSETWQLVINTGTTIVTFLMVFLIQKSQNKDSMAIQLKLNELVASHKYASNRLIDVEDLSEAELEALHQYYLKLSELCKKEDSLLHTHSVDEAEEVHKAKSHKRPEA
ncbi:low affinity iron permease family protein [Flavobacterium sp. MAH-1]|uniref:Low affinity iron permease family protein n=1 Tax=Flavobacterium agri TaxID=2743471 RepID=A0A7Y8XYL4_9FLAO|nr:low affinity iron permease family protein [Flavobacterium agri]NUY79315.1 low affinity iron permease family protein [Flavobacterium agri]NYA69339.1 low affinity iron permease family protein [Flavobacterium agri]